MSAGFLQWESYYRDWIPGKKQGPYIGLYKCIYLLQGWATDQVVCVLPIFKGDWLKENRICLIVKEIQKRAVAKSYMTNGLLICGEIFAHFLIY
jgi:hypothetical protein